jgi:hypothetical protein
MTSPASQETRNVRRLDRSYVRDVPGEITSGGYALVIHLAGPKDTSPAHRTYPTGCDSIRCGWCYLGANHSVNAHNAKVAAYRAETVES